MKTKREIIEWLQQMAVVALEENKDNYLTAALMLNGQDPLMEDGDKLFTVALVPAENDTAHHIAVMCRLFTRPTTIEEFKEGKHNFALAKHSLYPVLEGYVNANAIDKQEMENGASPPAGKPN
jgi:hypothetical protein